VSERDGHLLMHSEDKAEIERLKKECLLEHNDLVYLIGEVSNAVKMIKNNKTI
jgi:hypothetical protein